MFSGVNYELCITLFRSPRPPAQYLVIAPPCFSTASTLLAMLGMRDAADG